MTQQAPDYGECLRCKTVLQYLGEENFMVGGSSGLAKMIFGQWAELSESNLPLYVFVCPNCRKVELRAPEKQ